MISRENSTFGFQHFKMMYLRINLLQKQPMVILNLLHN